MTARPNTTVRKSKQPEMKTIKCLAPLAASWQPVDLLESSLDGDKGSASISFLSFPVSALDNTDIDSPDENGN